MSLETRDQVWCGAQGYDEEAAEEDEDHQDDFEGDDALMGEAIEGAAEGVAGGGLVEVVVMMMMVVTVDVVEGALLIFGAQVLVFAHPGTHFEVVREW